MTVDLTQFHAVFFEESFEALDVMEAALLKLDVGSPEPELINTIFRVAHSIKGGSATFGFAEIASFTHSLETLLDELRSGTMPVTVALSDLLLKSVDVLRAMLRAVQAKQPIDAQRVSDLQFDLEVAIAKKSEPASIAAVPVAGGTPSVPAALPSARWRIHFRPYRELLARGNDPLRMLRELAGLGELVVRVDSQMLPPFADVNPQDCYLAWSLELPGEVPEEAIGQVFEWAEGDCNLTLERLPAPTSSITTPAQGAALQPTSPTAAGAVAPIEAVPMAVPGGSAPGPRDPARALAAAPEAVPMAVPGGSAPGPRDPARALAAAPEAVPMAVPGGSAPGPRDPARALAAAPEAVPMAVPGGSAPGPRDPARALAAAPEAVPMAVPGGSAPGPRDPARALAAAPEAVPMAVPGGSAPGPRDPARALAAAPLALGDSGSIRVSVEKIDELMNTVGELVITQAMLSQLGAHFDGPDAEKLRGGLAQLERNMRELQESVMRVRMLPISFVFSRFPRMVRDLAQRLGKQIELKLTGEQTELDKTVLEKIGDPLVHLVRNCIDHGIELPEARIAAGKSAAGTLHLDAYHRGGNIAVEVTDDGGGIDKERILAKARARGLVGESDSLTDAEIYELIFLPGFSTAEKTTDVSGRGVGMDVVRRNVKELGGKIDVRSESGRGSQFTITLPLTLAIVDGQSVAVGTETYIVPLISIVESMQLKASGVTRLSGRREVLSFRGDYLPIVRLHELFGVEPRSRALHEGLVVVAEGEGRRIGLFVDDLLGQQQVVIKSLEANYGHIEGVSGATILGDGSVALILDVPGLIRAASMRAAA